MELLAVVAIVAVLAALLFPVVSGGMDRAGEARCLNNLANLQRVNIAFANENNGDFMPAWVNSATGGLSRQWFNQEIFRTYLDIPVGQWGVLNWPAKTICPKAEIAQQSLEQSPPNGAGAMARCYGYNIEGNDVNWGAPGAGNALRNLRVVRPATTIAFVDALDWIVASGGSSAYTGAEERTQSKMTAYRHNDAANAVFFDGHAERLPRSELDVKINPKNITKWQITE